MNFTAGSRREVASRTLWLGDVFHRAARRHPGLWIETDRPMLSDAGMPQRFTVDQAASLVDRLCQIIEASGLQRGRHVAIRHTDGFDIPILASAVSRCGAVPVLLSPYLPFDVVQALIRKLPDPVVIVDDELTTADEHARLAGEFPVWRTDPIEGLHLPAGPLTGGARTPPRQASPAEQPMLVTHTSGTTRLPKMTVHSARTLWYRVVPQRIISLGLRRDLPAFMSVTLVHTRFYMALEMFLWRGKPLIISCGTETGPVGERLVAHRPDYLETHPNTFVDWEPLAVRDDEPLASVKIFHAAFDAIHPRTMQTFLKASRHRRPLFFRFYGQSEVGPATGQFYTRASAAHSSGQCVGWPVPGFVAVRIVDDEGRPVPQGRIGHIQVRSRSRILTYLGDETLFDRSRDGQWWHTGDLGHRDRWGRLYLADRAVDEIDGIRSTLEYEDILMERLTATREVVVVDLEGVPTALMSVHAGERLDHQQVRAAVAETPGIAAAHVVEHRTFPLTATRKVQRPLLRQRLTDPGFRELNFLETVDLGVGTS